jgi:cytochrome c-type biogenesis protein CcmH
MRRVSLLLLLLAGVLNAVTAQAVIETYEFSDPLLEARYQDLSGELRCPKCQNQNIADSNAPIAQDLRKLLHQQLETGASDEEILQYMVDRYGEFVRYRPRFSGATALLWLAPGILLVLGGLIVVMTLRGRRKPGTPESELTEDDQRRLRDLIAKAEKQ